MQGWLREKTHKVIYGLQFASLYHRKAYVLRKIYKKEFCMKKLLCLICLGLLLSTFASTQVSEGSRRNIADAQRRFAEQNAKEKARGEAYARQMIQENQMRREQEANRIKYTVVNSTGKGIQEIYISSSSSDSWGKNLYSNQNLFQSGYQIEFKSDNVGPYDIKIVDSQGNAYIKPGVRITSNLAITFTQQDKEKKSFMEKLGNVWNYLFSD
jgi:hypothetical protein